MYVIRPPVRLSLRSLLRSALHSRSQGRVLLARDAQCLSSQAVGANAPTPVAELRTPTELSLGPASRETRRQRVNASLVSLAMSTWELPKEHGPYCQPGRCDGCHRVNLEGQLYWQNQPRYGFTCAFSSAMLTCMLT